MRQRTSKESGTVLILTCAVLSVVVVLVASLSFATGIDVTSSQNALAELKNRQAILSSLQIARTLYASKDSGDSSPARILSYLWQCGDVEVTVVFRDEERKLSIKSLTDPRGKIIPSREEEISRLLRRFVPDADAVLSRLCDYIDEDSEGPFENNAKNAPLDTVDELLLLDGINREAFFGDSAAGKIGLRDVLTLDSTGKVNINTASAEVLMCLSAEIDEAAAREIVEARASQPFSQPYDAVKRGLLPQDVYNKISGRLTSVGSTYSVLIEAKCGNCTKRCEALLKRRSGGADVVRFKEVGES